MRGSVGARRSWAEVVTGSTKPTTNQARLGNNDAATTIHNGDYTDETGTNTGTSPPSHPHVNSNTTRFASSNA